MGLSKVIAQTNAHPTPLELVEILSPIMCNTASSTAGMPQDLTVLVSRLDT